jgi:NAD(P)-dependent dehydrogenase (short-subunit alcohol dehydrogenase family)
MPTYLITGARRGIGLELARRLTSRGDHVIAAIRDPSSPGGLADLPVQVVAYDAAVAESADALARQVSTPIDVLINNAGVSSSAKSLEAFSAEELQRVIMINALAPVLALRALLPALTSGNRRAVINVSSVMGSIAKHPGHSYGYSTSKAALNMLTSCLADELRASLFTVVALHPGWVRTDMGGPAAPLSVEQSVASMLKVIDRLGPQDSGRFFDHDGSELAW